MKKYNSIVKNVNGNTTKTARGSDYTDIEIVNEGRESCNRCHKVFSSKSIIVAVYGMLFCSDECAFEEFPDFNEDDLEILLANDIGVE